MMIHDIKRPDYRNLPKFYRYLQKLRKCVMMSHMKKKLAMMMSLLLLAGCAGKTAAKQDGTEEGLTAEKHAVITVQDYGEIYIDLDRDSAPVTVDNFVQLTEEGFYDGLTFHRIMDGFILQGGDPEGNGFGGSDATIFGEFSSNGFDNPIKHVAGVISMARATDPDSGSSQFFILLSDQPHLDGNYAAFGWVADDKSMKVARKIAADSKPLDNNGTIAPEDQPVITSIKMLDD